MPSKEEIESRQTPAGGYTRETLAEWGVPWPPPEGWKAMLIEEDRLYGHWLHDLMDDVDAFYLLNLCQREHRWLNVEIGRLVRPWFNMLPYEMAEAGWPPWSSARIARARDALIERGYIEPAARSKKRFRLTTKVFPEPHSACADPVRASR